MFIDGHKQQDNSAKHLNVKIRNKRFFNYENWI